MSYRKHFEENGYVIVPNVLDESSLYLAYNYALTTVQSKSFKQQTRPEVYDDDWDGNWGDAQSPNTYSRYGDPFMDTLLILLNGKMNEFTGLDLIPTYSYWRFYEKGDDLKPHTDRESCEISTTIPLGYNYENEDYNWPICIKGLKGNTVKAPLKAGDLLIYKGCELEHWRDKFEGLNQAQVFLHYNNKNGPYNHMYDNRPNLGIPKKWRK